jgi:MEMO1 family protein
MKVVGYAIALALAGAPVTLAPERAGGRTRPPALAGTWYPEGRAALLSAAHLLMRVGAPVDRLPSKPVALVVPHAGWTYSGPVAGTAFRVLRPGDFSRVVVMGPSHHQGFRGYAIDDASAYATPIGEVPLCEGAFAALRGPEAAPVPAAVGPEHSIEIELPFLQAALGRFCLVPVLVGDTDAEAERAFAARLAKLDDGRTLFVFSTDFSHYGPRFDYQPFGKLSPEVNGKVRAMNERARSLLSAVDAAGFRSHLRETGNTICGRNGLATLLELLPLLAPKAVAVTLGAYASSDISGLQDDSSVSYAALAFLREGAPPPLVPLVPLATPPRLEDAPPDTPALSPESGTRLLQLARAALDAELRGTDDLQAALASWPAGREQERRQGVFVTLNRTDPRELRTLGKLRGCIGQPEPTYPLYYGTVQAAVDAALHDPRFEPVRAEELQKLEVEVTVLSPRKPIASFKEIRIGTHGVVLQKNGHAALFLPQVAPEQGWNVEQMLEALSEKAGLAKDAWREGSQLSVFTGQVFEEHR